MLPIGPERWDELRRVAAQPALAAILWIAAASFANAAARDESGRVAPAARRHLRTARTALALLGTSAWLRAGYGGARRYGLTMEEVSLAGGLAGAFGALVALAVSALSRPADAVTALPRERLVTGLLVGLFVALAGYAVGAALAATGAFLERRAT